jgi:cobalamin biosynthesis Mg chelatase CobN
LAIETTADDTKFDKQRQDIIVIIWVFKMTFEEMQSIMQSIIISQREMQADRQEMQVYLRDMQADRQQEMLVIIWVFKMTFEEMQSIMQSIIISQREMQADRQEMQASLRETQNLAQSIARGVQAMQDKALSDELKRAEERALQEAQLAELKDISRGLVNMLSSIDEDRPTILRKLNTIENKTDTIIDRLNRN